MRETQGLSLAMLEEIRRSIESAGMDPLPILRARYPGVHFTVCSEDDIPARLSPFQSGAGFDLYLADASSHCISFTPDPASASGVVIALHAEDEQA